jgi:hypothetical protein
MAEASVPGSAGVLDRISRNITVVGSIIAAFVAMNTALTTCSAQTIARHQTFRQAVDAEETYWRNLYNDYLGIFRQGVSGDERSARFFALSVLAQRNVPEFREYSFGILGGSGGRELAQERLLGMKNRLNEVLARPESSDPRLAAQRQDQTFAAAVGGVRTATDRDQATASGDSAAIAPAPVATGVNYLPQTLTRGDPQGWDFDIFWCGGGGAAVEGVNYSIGLEAARTLSDLAAARRTIAEGQIGRVRLIMLPEARQGGTFPARGAGLEIRPERIRGEPEAAAAVRGLIPGGGAFRVVASDTQSPWYVSLFSCRAGQPPARRPAANSAAPGRGAS